MRFVFFKVPVLVAFCALAACRPELHSDLPSADAAYADLEQMRAGASTPFDQLSANDQVSVSVFREEDLSIEGATIDQAGYISLPLIGQIKAAGYSTAQLSREIEQAYGSKFLRDPHVNVVLTKGAPRTITVEGEVKSPGVFEVQQGYTLLTALALAGSPIETAKLDEIIIFRNTNGQRYGGRFNVTDIRAGRMKDPQLMAGDTIVVGYSNIRGIYLDFLKTAPLIGAFARY